MARVVILEPTNYNEQALRMYGRLGEVYLNTGDEFALRAALQDAEVLVIRLRKVTSDLLALAPKLRVIASPTTGLDHIDQAETTRRNIKIVSLKGRRDITEKIYATSELTLTLMLGLLRHLPSAHAHVLEGGWDRERFVGGEISGKTIGIVGCGRLGIRVAEIVHRMGARVIGTDPLQPPENVPAFITRVSLPELLAKSDIVSLHVSLTPETEKLFGAAQFAMMKRGAMFVNTSRGQIVDEAALLQALESGQVGFAALDVLQGEDGNGQHLIQNALRTYAKAHDNLLLVPHIGGATKESMGMTEIAIAGEVGKQFPLRVLGVITARGGSKGVPRKNIRDLGGKPLIAWTIEAAKKSSHLTEFVVSTDDEEIASVSRQWGARVPFLRPAELATDAAKSIPVIQHALAWFRQEEGKEFDAVMILQPTSPLRTSEDIDACIRLMQEQGADSVMSMLKLIDISAKKLKRLEGDKIVPWQEEEGTESASRHQTDEVYKRNCAVYLTRTSLIEANDLFGKDSRAYIMPAERSIDINTPLDFSFAEFLVSQEQQKG